MTHPTDDASHKFMTSLDCDHHTYQKKAWIDKDLLNNWIDLIFVLCKHSKKFDITLILIQAAYCTQVMRSIWIHFYSLRIKVIHIPVPIDRGIIKTIRAGCTRNRRNGFRIGRRRVFLMVSLRSHYDNRSTLGLNVRNTVLSDVVN